MNRAQRVATLLLLGAALFLLINPERMSGLRGGVWLVLGRIERPLQAAGDGPGPEAKLREELRALRQALVARDEALLRERQELRLLRAFREAFPAERAWPLVPARVIHRSDPKSGERKLLLSRGLRDGVREGMPVVRGGALVGIVRAAHPASSVVALLTDPECRVRTFLRADPPPAAEGQPRAEPAGRHAGVAVGTADGIALELVRTGEEPRRGDLVFTSGLDARVPHGLLIGRVSRVDRQPHAYQVPVEVEPELDLAQLDEVHVLCRPPQRLERASRGPRPSGR